jgi:hypothetical protein
MESGGYFPILAKHENTIFVFCRTGAGHLGKNGKIAVLSSLDGLDWHYKGTVEKDNADIRNPAVYIFPDGKILLALYRYNAYDEKGMCSPSKNKSPNNYDLLFFTSDDGGATWKEQGGTNLDKVYGDIGKVSPHGKMFLYKGELLLPVYNKLGCFLLSSKDDGQSWDIFSHISDLLEPFVTEMPNNELIAVMRAGRKSPFGEASLVSIYRNNEWTEPVCVTERMQHPAGLLVLSNNQLLLYYGDRNFGNQRILVKLSADNGQTWSRAIQVGDSFQNCDFGYPSTIELPEGKLLSVFYAKQSDDPYFYFGNMEFYDCKNAKGYCYQYSLRRLLEFFAA